MIILAVRIMLFVVSSIGRKVWTKVVHKVVEMHTQSLD
jgi:hypothetical protein